MNKPILITLSCALIAGTVGAAAAFNLGQKKRIKEQEHYFNKNVVDANKQCNSNFAARIDWKSFEAELDKHIDGKIQHSFHSRCSTAVNALYSICQGDADAKPVVAAGVKKYTCKFGGPKKRKMTLSKGSLTMWIDWESKNDRDYALKFLRKSL